ncbi:MULTISPECIES: hypothetical protein [unclassified Streptomyces]|uniref:hypothetical protein n=1 Tax=unclassified Streptomyces TaxID=2593676 RepID=UPI0018FEDEF7|nr:MULTISPECIES: hypothetical protein [unclassified Streptomyces]
MTLHVIMAREATVKEEVWVLGATGRLGSGITAKLTAAGVPVTVLGRTAATLERLAAAHAGSGAAVRTRAGSFEETLDAIRSERPRVVVNTIGPFTRTAPAVIDACGPGTHYADVGNEPPAARAVFDAEKRASEQGSTFVTSAGFGVLGTESALLKLLEGRPAPHRVRVDGIASVAVPEGAGPLGEAFARTIIEGLTTSSGSLAGPRIGSEPQKMTTPDGDQVTTAALPSVDVLAAARASGAATVVAASAEAPHGAAAALLPAIVAALRIGPLRRFAVKRLAAVQPKPKPAPRAHTWARAHAVWDDGHTAECWLRAGEAMEFSVAAASEVARRLHAGEGRPGAFTPAALFGPALAESIGGDFVTS